MEKHRPLPARPAAPPQRPAPRQAPPPPKRKASKALVGTVLALVLVAVILAVAFGSGNSDGDAPEEPEASERKVFNHSGENVFVKVEMDGELLCQGEMGTTLFSRVLECGEPGPIDGLSHDFIVHVTYEDKTTRRATLTSEHWKVWIDVGRHAITYSEPEE